MVNRAWELAPWADLLYGCDASFWEKYKPAFDGLRVTQDARPPGLLRVPSLPRPGLSRDPTYIHQGANSGYQALNLAVHLGCNPILLLGFDMKPGPNGESHWHGDHVAGLNNPCPENFKMWRDFFATTVPDLARAGVEVLNCTPDSALDCFPRARLEDVI